MSAPSIQTWLEESDLNRYEFRLLAAISRRAGRNGMCYESVPNLAERCGMSERTAQKHLPALVKAGYIRIKQAATPNSTAHYALTSKMHVGDDFVALFAPAWLDDAGLSPEAVRLFYHYLRWSWDGEVEANHARAARTCGAGLSSPNSVRRAEHELCKAGRLEPRARAGKHAVFAVKLPQTVQTVHPAEVGPKAEPLKRCTPTAQMVHPDRSNGAPKGFLKGLSKGSSNDDFSKSPEGQAAAFFRELLGREYQGFTNFVSKRLEVSEALNKWFGEWGETRIRCAWDFLRENATHWSEKHGKRFGPLYGLFDALEGTFDNGQPQRLCSLWVSVRNDMLEKKRAAMPRFEPGDIVRVRDLKEEFEVASCSGIRTFFTDDRMAFSDQCTFIRRASPVMVNQEDLVPAFIRRRQAAQENLARRGVTA
jgi:hypothetical protein